jgi:hypothetical protein
MPRVFRSKFLTFLAPTTLPLTSSGKQANHSFQTVSFITCAFNPSGLNAVCRVYQELNHEKIMENLISELAVSILKRQAPLLLPEQLNVFQISKKSHFLPIIITEECTSLWAYTDFYSTPMDERLILFHICKTSSNNFEMEMQYRRGAATLP